MQHVGLHHSVHGAPQEIWQENEWLQHQLLQIPPLPPRSVCLYLPCAFPIPVHPYLVPVSNEFLTLLSFFAQSQSLCPANPSFSLSESIPATPPNFSPSLSVQVAPDLPLVAFVQLVFIPDPHLRWVASLNSVACVNHPHCYPTPVFLHSPTSLPTFCPLSRSLTFPSSSSFIYPMSAQS